MAGSIPKDVLVDIKRFYPSEADYDEVIGLFTIVSTARLNVGVEQLMRCILILAENDLCKIREIIRSKYWGDPRDVVVAAKGKVQRKRDAGMRTFIERTDIKK